MASVLLGTSGLALAALVAFALTLIRGEVAAERVPGIRRVAAVAVLFQFGHFVEETMRQFYLRFPEVLGLAPWSREFFLSFNLAWLFIWIPALCGLTVYRRVSVFALWFLALASAANGVVHPLLAIAVGGYFPGLWTAPFIGVQGVMLFVWLMFATGTTRKSQAPAERV